MTDKLNAYKEGIISALRINGPSLPVPIAQKIGVSPLFASAFLSELKAEQKIKISEMRVGSSPIYYLQGQEEKLENFTQYLNNREKDAFDLIKKEKMLDDEKQAPVNRVALRAIRDFAIPIKVNINNEDKLFWKYFLINDEDFTKLVEKSLKKEREVVQKEPEKIRQKEEKVEEKIKEPEKKIDKEIEEIKQIKKTEKKIKNKESEFSKNVKNYLATKDMEILEIFSEKKKEIEGKLRIDILFGKQEYYFIAKDKKNFTENDLAVALQRAQSSKLPALGFSNGELNKKGKEYLKHWGNLVKFEKLNI